MYHNEGYDKGEVVKNLCLRDTQKVTTNYVCSVSFSYQEGRSNYAPAPQKCATAFMRF